MEFFLAFIILIYQTPEVCFKKNRDIMEKFSLKWNDFHSNVSKSFQSLRNKEDFSDVTLVGDDFKQIAAHKIILSSCSAQWAKPG